MRSPGISLDVLKLEAEFIKFVHVHNLGTLFWMRNINGNNIQQRVSLWWNYVNIFLAKWIDMTVIQTLKFW